MGELKQFKLCEGHCNVPNRFSENPSLGTWVHHQRTQYRYMKQGKPSYITEPRIRLLVDIGFTWSVDDVAWLKKFEELKQFRCNEGHCNVPQKFDENPSLGVWVKNQRKQYRLMKQGTASRLTDNHVKL